MNDFQANMHCIRLDIMYIPTLGSIGICVYAYTKIHNNFHTLLDTSTSICSSREKKINGKEMISGGRGGFYRFDRLHHRALLGLSRGGDHKEGNTLEFGFIYSKMPQQLYKNILSLKHNNNNS
uniref:Uncharacterized protein n=1 Tax=Sphaerodactylus townsendi TaxID=933632 RepID=A0ACB8FH12_9SAUR